MKTGFKGSRKILERTISITADPDTVFPLLCPVREAEWVEGWVGRPVFASSGVAELDGVYATEHAGEQDSLWVITRFDPARHELEFVYVLPGTQIVHLGIKVARLEPQRSSLSVRYVRTGTSDQGNLAIEALGTSNEFEAMMTNWERSMNHFLQTGSMLLGAG